MNATEILYVQVVGAAFDKGYHDAGGAKELLDASMGAFMQSPYAQRDVLHFTDSWVIEQHIPTELPDGTRTWSKVSKRYMGFAVPRQEGDPMAVEFVNGQQQ